MYLIKGLTDKGRRAIAKNKEDYNKLPGYIKLQKKATGIVETYSVPPGELLPVAMMLEIRNKRIAVLVGEDDVKRKIDLMMFENGADKTDYSFEEVKE